MNKDLNNQPEFAIKTLLQEFLGENTVKSAEFIEGAECLFVMMLDEQAEIDIKEQTNGTGDDCFMFGFFEALRFYSNLRITGLKRAV